MFIYILLIYPRDRAKDMREPTIYKGVPSAYRNGKVLQGASQGPATMLVGGSGGRCFTVPEVAFEELRKESESRSLQSSSLDVKRSSSAASVPSLSPLFSTITRSVIQ